MKNTPRSHFGIPGFKEILLSLVFCYTISMHLPATADQKSDLRMESLRVAEQFLNDEISEKTALERLDEITSRAQALRDAPAVAPAVAPVIAKPEFTHTEELAGSVLLRKAALPSLSLWGVAWSIFKPVLLLSIGVLVLLGIAIAIFGIRRIEMWSNALGTKFGTRRNAYYPSQPRTRPLPPRPLPPRPLPPRPSPIPMAPARHQAISRNTAGYPALIPGTRHSGEVPDHLT